MKRKKGFWREKLLYKILDLRAAGESCYFRFRKRCEKVSSDSCVFQHTFKKRKLAKQKAWEGESSWFWQKYVKNFRLHNREKKLKSEWAKGSPIDTRVPAAMYRSGRESIWLVKSIRECVEIDMILVVKHFNLLLLPRFWSFKIVKGDIRLCNKIKVVSCWWNFPHRYTLLVKYLNRARMFNQHEMEIELANIKIGNIYIYLF